MPSPPEFEILFEATKRQLEALDYLEDGTTTETFYGGGAGGGKSFLGCAWLILNCLKLNGSRWLMGRTVLKTLKESTLLTFFSVCRMWGIKSPEHFTYHPMEGVLRFYNGSEIYLKDLEKKPSDPEFDELGSTEYTGAFIDEGSQLSHKAWQVIKSRLRYKLNEFGRIDKILICSNPAKNFLHYDFYKPWKENALPPYRKLVQALVEDNPYIPPQYIENLKKLDKATKERLLYGNWDYDDDPSRLFEYDAIMDIFNLAGEKSEEKYLTGDIARFGSDKCVLKAWEGLRIVEVKSFSHSSVTNTASEVMGMEQKHGIRRSHIILDEDGVGGGVVDIVKGCVGFVNNSRPIEPARKPDEQPLEQYANLKSQCYFKLAEYVRTGKIGCYAVPANVKEAIIEELEQIKRKDADKDGKLRIIGKDEIKEKLGRSPDFADAMMMRMQPELRGKRGITLAGWSNPKIGIRNARDAQVADFIFDR